MSFPRKLHLLIIEDEQDPIDGYRELLKAYQKEFPSVEPTVARSYADAKLAIESPTIFHLVILDLNLPLANREDAHGNLEPGKQLLDLIARREHYPVPVLLVVSGKLGLTRLTDLQARLDNDFWYGAMVNKGPDVPDDLKKGLQKAHEYADVGIHVADSGREWYPTISPCEEDLLRRCVLSQRSCLGVDLEWWGAEIGPSPSRPSLDYGPTKVLMGRFILDDGFGVSRPTFFKFEPEGNAHHTCRDAGILDQKLSHVKVKYSHAGRGRCLLVTQSVTDSRPVSFDRFLGGDAAAVQPHLPQLIADIGGQLDQLGLGTDDQIPANELIWKHHDRDSIEKAWGQYDVRPLVRGGLESPLEAFDQLRRNTDLVWATRRSCTHGDLNATNVAIDRCAAERPKAYIFDAGGMHRDIATRDFAVLEVTTLLFLAAPEIQQNFPVFRAFYTDADPLGVIGAQLTTLPTVVQNVVHLLAAIRGRVQAMPNPEIYPVVVFDTVMIQLGGLAVQPTRNKISSPLHANLLGSWTASWARKITPQLFTAVPPPEGSRSA